MSQIQNESKVQGKTQQQYAPSHPGLFEVEFDTDPDSHASRLVAKRDFSPNELLAILYSPVFQYPARSPIDSNDNGDSGFTSTVVGSPFISPKRDWTTIQISLTHHLFIGSDLVYMNHSCGPSAIVNISSPYHLLDSIEVGVLAGPNGIKKGEEITFFYPSTEWDMSRPFKCFCAETDGKCLGMIGGSKYIDDRELKARGWFINEHIWELKRSQGRNESARM